MSSKTDKFLEVDGVVYDISSGRVISDNKKKSTLKSNNSVLDLRTPHNIVASSQRAIQKREVQSRPKPRADNFITKPHVAYDKTSHVHKSQTKPVLKAHATKLALRDANTNTIDDQDMLDYFGFVFLKGVFPKGNLRLWQLSLIRTIFSPQTWLLLTLPLVILQVRVIRHYTLNETIQKAKSFVAPDHYNQVTLAFAFMLVAFLVGVVIRSCITATGISVRLREIDSRPIKVINALRSAMHSIIRQALNYFIHLVIVVMITVGLLLISKSLFLSTNPWVSNSRYQILVSLFLAWVIVLVFLYAKHWLQVGLLSRSSKTSHIQVKSIKLLFTTPSANLVSGLTGLLLITLCYIVIFSMSWYVTNYFVSQAGAPAILILILIAFTTIILLTTLQYIQQSLWAKQYYYSSLNSSDKGELLYMEPTKPDSVWPIFVVLAVAAVLMLVYFVIANLYAARLKGFLANIHASIPDEINVVVPIKK